MRSTSPSFPFSSAASSSSSTICWVRSRRDSTTFGVNAFDTSPRSRVWSGGSRKRNGRSSLNACAIGSSSGTLARNSPVSRSMADVLTVRARRAGRAGPKGSRRGARPPRSRARFGAPAPARATPRRAGTDRPSTSGRTGRATSSSPVARVSQVRSPTSIVPSRSLVTGGRGCSGLRAPRGDGGSTTAGRSANQKVRT